MLDMLLGDQQIIQTQMRRAWLGKLKIIVAEMKEIGFGRDEINNRPNARNAARYERMHCIARSNTIPDYNYLGEMNYICKHCGAKKFPDETHFLCCDNGKGSFVATFIISTRFRSFIKGNYADRNANLSFLKYVRNYNACLSFVSFEAYVVQPMNHGPPCF